jgi:hypothetical protein
VAFNAQRYHFPANKTNDPSAQLRSLIISWYCNNYKDTDGKRFRLVANSWDEILFSKL